MGAVLKKPWKLATRNGSFVIQGADGAIYGAEDARLQRTTVKDVWWDYTRNEDPDLEENIRDAQKLLDKSLADGWAAPADEFCVGIDSPYKRHAHAVVGRLVAPEDTTVRVQEVYTNIFMSTAIVVWRRGSA